MVSSKFTGVGTALVTPFRNDGSIDFSALKNLINFQIENGVSYLVALGTTSEAATMSNDEKHAIIDFIIEENNGRVPLVVGCGGNHTASVVKEIKSFEKEGIDAILSVAPFYNKPNQRGIYEHFKAIAHSTHLPIILYNVPGRTASNIKASTIIKLANNFQNIIAVKEASGNLEKAMQLVKNKPEGFTLISGDDALTLPLISLGFDGVTSVVSNGFPKEFSTLVAHALQNDFQAARSIQYQLVDLIKSLFDEGSPAGIKAVLTLKGYMENNLRLPLVEVSGELFATIEQQLMKLEEA